MSGYRPFGFYYHLYSQKRSPSVNPGFHIEMLEEHGHHQVVFKEAHRAAAPTMPESSPYCARTKGISTHRELTDHFGICWRIRSNHSAINSLIPPPTTIT